jgi:Heterokaryon incompatibility protein (HET)
MSARSFVYTPLPAGHVRLLGRPPPSLVVKNTVEIPGIDSYKLTTFAIDHCPAYIAISYCWGTEASTQPCQLNTDRDDGGVLPITPHLQAGLRKVFAVLKPDWVWVDAICITQNDEVEKAAQVAQMGEIFERARRVVVWLGGDYDGSERVMGLMPLLTSSPVLELLADQTRIDWDGLVQLRIPACDDQFWVWLFDLLHRPWFERLWIVQEAVLGRDIVFLCGELTLSWDRLKSLCATLRDSDLLRELGVRSELWKENRKKYRSFRALDVIESVDDIKQMRVTRPWVAALVLLALIRKQISNEPLDYVYGVLGLLPESCRSNVTVYYSETSRKWYGYTYAQLFQALIKGMGDAALMFLNNIETPPGAPSWCPELRSRTQPGYSSFRVSEVGAGCNPSKIGLQTPRIPVFEFQTADTISVRGAVIDTVDRVVPLVRPGKLWSYPLLYNDEEIVGTCVSFHLCTLAAKKLNISDAALARTLTGQMTSSKDEETRFARALSNVIAAFSKLSESAEPLDASSLAILLSDHEAMLYTKLLWSHWNGRSFITTMSGHIGLALRTTKPGDSVCIFFGAPKPYIMRLASRLQAGAPSDSVGERRTHKIIAECYVDGIMNGELFQEQSFDEDATVFYIS